ncbi:TPA: radical SAM protein, partial [bacterium]|nr:radical SAM protein [bacterium]
TGGEPLLNVELLNKVLNLIFEVIEDAKVTLNTNGYNLEKIFELDNLSKIDGIHLSRHHYKDDVNNKIFGLDVVTKERLIEINKKLKNKHLLRLNCLLMKDHIGNIGEVNKYLELASKIGVFRVGFVSLMKVNEFCNDQFVDFNDVFKESQGTMLNTEKYYDTDICECKNGVYVAKNGEFIEYYARMTKSSKCDYCRQFVYSADNKLTTGFGRESII